MLSKETWKQLTERGDGLSALDLIHPPVDRNGFTGCMQSLANLYRVNYASPEWRSFSTQIYAMVTDAGWSEQRLSETAQWIAKNVAFANLTAADFFKAPVKSLFGRAWYEEQCFNGKGRSIEGYNVQGIVLYRFEDGAELPFPKVIQNGKSLMQGKPEPEEERGTTPMPEELRETMRKVLSSERTESTVSVAEALEPQPEVEPLDADTEAMLLKAQEEARERAGVK